MYVSFLHNRLYLYYWLMLLKCINAIFPFQLPADSCGAFIVVLAVSSKWFTVHDPPQRSHPSYPPRCVDPAWIWTLVRAGPDQRTCADLVKTKKRAQNGTELLFVKNQIRKKQSLRLFSVVFSLCRIKVVR